jgi:hypothetical protein
MSLRFYAFNQVDLAVITPSSQSAQFPVSNIKDPRRTKVFRSTVGGVVTLVFDFQEPVNIDAVLLADPKIRQFNFTTASIQLNNTNSWVTPPVDEALTINQDKGLAKFTWSTPQVYRYARLELTGAGDYVELSKVFIGEQTSILGRCFTYPLNYRPNNLAVISRNIYGQKFIDERVTQKAFSGSVGSMDKDEVDVLFEVLDYCSITRPLWLLLDIEALNDTDRISGMYFLQDEPSLSLVAGNFWNSPLSFEEAT